MIFDPNRNNLDRETSPYLRQHADNPVHWQAWSAAALAHAAAVDKPILLSVGYAACHWCHVMAHESFEDAETAAVMNRLFVNIKVDREERPDIDTIYQSALALLGEHGGWPLTMFLSPDGAPFWGGTYFPPEARWGRPAFRDLLARVARVFADEPDAVAQNRTALLNGLTKANRPPQVDGVPPLSPAVLDEVAGRFARDIDPVHGGIGAAPKFPNVSNLTLIWQAWRRTGKPEFGDPVMLTLDRMAQGGIYDHLRGGFARYATDPAWLVPHFEKMLYDNAELIGLYAEVWADTAEPLFAARIRETVDWLQAEMIAAGGGFAATLDADSEGEEGRFYVWTAAEIDAVLGEDAKRFKQVYGVSRIGNWEGRNILNRSDDPGGHGPAVEAQLAAGRAKLLNARAGRVRPGWDDKVLADWNGLMIASLTRAACLFGEADWLSLATRAFAFVAREMTGADGRLRHSHRLGQARHVALIDDYANMARAALALFEATGAADYLIAAERWTAIANDHYWDEGGGGYFLTADDAEALIVRSRTAYDNPNPSGNGTMVGVLTRLWRLTGNQLYRVRAEAVIEAFAIEIARNVFPLATFLNNVETHFAATEVAILGDRADPAAARLIAAAHRHGGRNMILSVVPPGQDLIASHPAFGKTMFEGQPTAYVCRGGSCSLPVTTPDALAGLLVPAAIETDR